jgi:hypothetical protein
MGKQWSGCYRRCLVIVLVGCAIFHPAPIARAATDGDTCDDYIKYWCAHVDYAPDPYLIINPTRWYTGGTGGDPNTRSWRRGALSDWTWNGAIWSLVTDWGPGPSWYSNLCLGYPENLVLGCNPPGGWEGVSGGYIG